MATKYEWQLERTNQPYSCLAWWTGLTVIGSSLFLRQISSLSTTATNFFSAFCLSLSPSLDNMCRQNSPVHHSGEEEIAADESLLIYCKPVELYNILYRRALQNPSFLRRCLRYKISARRKRRLRAGIVIFNYRDRYNMLRKTEVTEDFSCPFCLMQCGSFKGLRFHLCSSHDLFNFEFWVTEDYQAVNVCVKVDILRSE
ncbi:Polycomb group protein VERNALIZATION 2, partial [Mucuna pruriens]